MHSCANTENESTTHGNLSLRILYGSFCVSFLLGRSYCCNHSRRILETLSVLEINLGVTLNIERELLLQLADDKEIEDRGTQLRKISLATSRLVPVSEMCPACNDIEMPLTWGDIFEARCQKGHAFGRCALTFLPLLQPTWQKECMSCAREFINEREHPEMKPLTVGGEKNHQRNHDEPDSATEGAGAQSNAARQREYLSYYLFEQFDTCPYCGGHFSNKHIPHSPGQSA